MELGNLQFSIHYTEVAIFIGTFNVIQVLIDGIMMKTEEKSGQMTMICGLNESKNNFDSSQGRQVVNCIDHADFFNQFVMIQFYFQLKRIIYKIIRDYI